MTVEQGVVTGTHTSIQKQGTERRAGKDSWAWGKSLETSEPTPVTPASPSEPSHQVFTDGSPLGPFSSNNLRSRPFFFGI